MTRVQSGLAEFRALLTFLLEAIWRVPLTSRRLEEVSRSLPAGPAHCVGGLQGVVVPRWHFQVLPGHPRWAHLHTVEGGRDEYTSTAALTFPPSPLPRPLTRPHVSSALMLVPLCFMPGAWGARSSAPPILEILLNWLGSLCPWRVGGGRSSAL